MPEYRRILLDGSSVQVRREGADLVAGDGRRVPASDAVHLPPAAPSKIVAVHLNHRSRVAEFGATLPPAPTYFHKPVSALVGHGGAVVRPANCRYLNYEGEIGRSVYAPSGNRLALESRPASGYAQVVVVDTASGRRDDIGSEKLNFSALEPTWAPDGARLAAITVNGTPSAASGPKELLIFGPGGAVLSRAAAGNLRQPAWSPLN